MKSAIFFFAFAIQAFAYNPFPINAWIQRGNGEMIEIPELVGKPDPNKTYRIWFTNYLDNEYSNIHLETDTVTICFQFEENIKETKNLASVYLGIFDPKTNYPSATTLTTGINFWYMPYSYEDPNEYVHFNIEIIEGFLRKEIYANRTNLVGMSYNGFPTMFPVNDDKHFYTIPIQHSSNQQYGEKSFGNSMGGIYGFELNESNIVSVVFPAGGRRGWGAIAGYIDICGAAIAGDPSQELKIESFNIDFNVENEGMWRTNSILNIEYCVNRRIRNYLTFTASIPSEWDEQYVCVERADNLTSEFIDIYGETKYPTAIISPNGIVTRGGRPEINVISGKFGETLRKTIKIELDYDDEYRAAEKKDFIQHRFYRLSYLDAE